MIVGRTLTEGRYRTQPTTALIPRRCLCCRLMGGRGRDEYVRGVPSRPCPHHTDPDPVGRCPAPPGPAASHSGGSSKREDSRIGNQMTVTTNDSDVTIQQRQESTVTTPVETDIY